MKHDLTSKNKTINTESNTPRMNRPGLRLIKCGPAPENGAMEEPKLNKPSKNLFVCRLKSLADSLDAEVDMILKL